MNDITFTDTFAAFGFGMTDEREADLAELKQQREEEERRAFEADLVAALEKARRSGRKELQDWDVQTLILAGYAEQIGTSAYRIDADETVMLMAWEFTAKFH